MSATSRVMPRRAVRAAAMTDGHRTLPEEVAVALSYNGSTHAVMMATPADLEDFGVGFSATEGIARGDDLREVTVVAVDAGYDVQMWLGEDAQGRQAARRRSMAGPVGCGLCGIDSIAQAIREPVPLTTTAFTLTAAQVLQAMAALPAGQTLHDATRAAHAAAFWQPGTGIIALREDVGRHNALDKLAGALLRAAENPAAGAVILTSRVSIDLVQKCVAIGAPVLIAASAPTAQAVAMADRARLTLIGLARGDGFEIFAGAHRILAPDCADVA